MPSSERLLLAFFEQRKDSAGQDVMWIMSRCAIGTNLFNSEDGEDSTSLKIHSQASLCGFKYIFFKALDAFSVVRLV